MMFLFLSAVAWTLPLDAWREAMVKIASFPCHTETPRFEGSGLVFKKEGVSYVITSEHVVIHSTAQEICHEAGGRGAVLVNADFSSGLALLRLPANIPGAVNFSELNGSTGVDLVALGFPAGSEGLVALVNGRLLTSESRRALIAGQAALLEASGLLVEYGMSGGVLLQGGKFAGILSHQVLKREAGRATRPGELVPGPGNSNDLALAIPGRSVKSWIERVLDGAAAEWVRESSYQMKGESALRHGSLLFNLKRGRAGDVWDIGGVDWGGSDGSGIGGEEVESEELSYVEMGFAPGLSPEEKSRAFHDPSLNRWRDWLLQGKKVRIVFLKNPAAKRLMRLQSLSQLLTFWQRDGWQPIAIRSRSQEGLEEGEVLLQKARAMESLAQAARDSSSSVEKKAWFALLRDQGVMAENLLASSVEIASLLTGENDRYWREFYDEDFERAVALESAIQTLVAQMRKMGL